MSRGTKIALAASATTLLAVVLLVAGDRTMRVFGGVLLAWSLLALIPAAIAVVRARSRIRQGRALIAGDPIRPEGINPDDVPR